jgi:hypothetical protein
MIINYILKGYLNSQSNGLRFDIFNLIYFKRFFVYPKKLDSLFVLRLEFIKALLNYYKN